MIMGGLSLQKRLAADILKVGISKVWLDPDHREDIKNAITRADIKKLIEKGYIKKRKGKVPYPYDSKRKKQNPGSRKGKKGSRMDPKRKWINTIRPIRKMLNDLKKEGKISKEVYKKAYRLAKAGTFRSRSHLKLYLQQKGVKI
jgi:large subunit ribosomal protein L19e